MAMSPTFALYSQYVHPTSSSPLVQHALDWIAAYTCWNLSDMCSLTSTASDFRYEFLPTSGGLGTKDWEAWHLYNTQMKAVIPDLWVEVLDLHEPSPGSDAIVAHIIGHATSVTGGDFHHECMLTVHVRQEDISPHPTARGFNHAPPASRPVYKVYKVVEFMDTGYTSSFFVEEKRRRAARHARHRRSRSTSYILSSAAPPHSLQDELTASKL
ncbi:hypothetical protein DL93DRAFT_847817 [Clavulina sp. PMI_390]|nr:hypothetical protein DL93DRAFT_847817 [Clavulina sp. PMI_390]